jgi:hypothetical protein
MIRLPISGARARWRSATGEDDIALADTQPGLAGAVAYVSRSVVDLDGVAIDAAELPIGDLDLLVVARRRELRGDSFVAEGTCAACGAAVDVEFSLAAYADHHRPQLVRRATAVADDPGWWWLATYQVTFRAPHGVDVLAALADEHPRRALLARCAREPVSARAARAVEAALARLAPTLRADVAGTCPECGIEVLLDVDARELCLAELRFLAKSVYDDVHLIASVYRWTQEQILGLPSARRRLYADLISGRVPEHALATEGLTVG